MVILTVVAFASVTALGSFYFHSARVTRNLRSELAGQLVANRERAAALGAARTANRELQAQLDDGNANLAAATARVTATSLANVQLVRESAQLRAQLEERSDAATRLAAEVDRLKLAAADQATPLALIDARATIAELQQRLAKAEAGAPLQVILTTSRGRTARIVSVGPSSAFVVLDYGAVHGAQLAQTMIIRRGTDDLASVLISDVRERYSIAQVQPDSLRGALHQGDSAVLAN